MNNPTEIWERRCCFDVAGSAAPSDIPRHARTREAYAQSCSPSKAKNHAMQANPPETHLNGLCCVCFTLLGAPLC